MPDDLQIVMKSSDILKKDDFLASFKNVLEYVLRIQKNQEEAITRLEETYQNLITKMNLDHETAFKDLRGQVDGLFVEGRLKEMDTSTKSSFGALKKDIDDLFGKKASEIDYKVSQIKPIRGDRGLPGLPGLPGKIDLETLNKIESKMKQLDEKISRIPRGGSRGKVPIIKRYSLTSQVDGSTKTFTLPRDTVDVIGIYGTQFPINFDPGTDWTFTGNTLTLTDRVSAPQTGQTLYAIIETLFYG